MNKVFASVAMAVVVLGVPILADNISLRNGQNVENAKVLKVGVGEIEYKVAGRQVLYTIRKAEVAKITYKNGAIDTFYVKEKRKDKNGGEFKKPRKGKWPGPGMGPRDEYMKFRGEPGEFSGSNGQPLPPPPPASATVPPSPVAPPPPAPAPVPPPPPPTKLAPPPAPTTVPSPKPAPAPVKAEPTDGGDNAPKR